MKRRQLLASTGALAVAGCLSDTSADTEDPNGEDAPPDDDRASGEPAVDVDASEATLATREVSGGRIETAVTGLVENTGGVRLGIVTAVGKFFNADGQLLSSSPWSVRDLEPGEVWEPWIPYAGDGDVDHASLSVTDAVAHGRTVAPEGLVLESSDIQIPADDNAMPRIVGTVANQSGADVSLLQARPKAIAENGHLLETAIGSVQNFSAGETWGFDQKVHFKNPDWTDRIADHRIVLTA